MLYGREHEQDVIGRLLDEVRGGGSGVLVLRGEPGIGKTALLEHAATAGSGAGFRVIRATGVEYEAELPFAGLNLLLAPGLDRLSALPGPQRRALEGAFGLADGADDADGVGAARPGDRLLTGLATLGLLAELASDQPLLCLVDDAQWLDRSSAEALLLAARRLRVEGIALLLAARDGEGSLPSAGLPELRLTGLADEAAAALLAARQHPALGAAPTTAPDEGAAGAEAPGPVPALSAVGRRVLAEAGGNPLALTELPAALAAEAAPPASPASATPAASRAGSAGPVAMAAGAGSQGHQDVAAPGGLPLTSRLQLAFHGQVTRLPAATQTLLLIAAAEETGDLAVVLRAAATLGALPEHLAPAEELGLVRISADRTLTFRHPLLRAAILQRAPLQQRLTAHRTIGEALDDDDRRTWHLALAATTPDAELADALERAAVRAEARGGHGGAAAAYERAARLTPDRDGGTRRLVLAAEAATEEGKLEQAEALADRAAARTDDPFARALLDHVRATAHFWRGAYPAAYRLLLDAAATPGIESRHAARMLFQAFHAAWYVGEEPVAAVLDRLAELPLPDGDPTAPLARHLLAGTLPLLGRPAPPLPAARDTAAAARRAGAAVPSDLVQVCGATLILGRDDETYELASDLVAEARAKGTVGVLPTLQFFLAEAELFHGRHRDAEVTASEALALAEDTGQRQWVSQLRALLAYLAALSGSAEECTALAGAALAGGGSAAAPGEPWAQWALGMLDLGQGRAAGAADRLQQLTTGRYRHHVSATRAVPDLVEAAVRLGAPERAAEPYERFARWSAATALPWAEALRLRCQALLSPDELAEPAYLAALKLHQEANRPFEQARTALLYGEWLRRERRRTDARPRLRAALEAFDLVGAHPWSDRARTELTATGTVAPAEPVAGPLAGLTPQELQIVRLAAQGLSNRDIAAQLFLSPRTVGHHLYKAYPKLGVAARGELAALVG